MMQTHRIAVISDTHGILRQEAVRVLQSVELILHGGDIADRRLLDELNQFARVITVRGNCDREWAEFLPREVFFELYGKKVYMIHNKKHISAKAEDADLIIYGHSHRYEEKSEEDRFWLNPGSAGPERFGRQATMAVLELDEAAGRFTVEKIVLSGRDMKRTVDGDSFAAGAEKKSLPADGSNSADAEKKSLPADGSNSVGAEKKSLPADGSNSAGAEKKSLPADFASGELLSMAAQIFRDLERGRSVERIVAARGVSRALTEQVCQIYFTHPGIDLEGVLDRMEIAGR